MERKSPGPDTGKIELQRIINCMKENKYNYTGSLDEGEYSGYYKLDFLKEIMYSDIKGNYINDRHIKVTIEFDTSFDYKTEYNEDFDYNSEKAQMFIDKIIDGTYDSKSNKKGGQRKTKKNKKSIK